MNCGHRYWCNLEMCWRKIAAWIAQKTPINLTVVACYFHFIGDSGLEYRWGWVNFCFIRIWLLQEQVFNRRKLMLFYMHNCWHSVCQHLQRIYEYVIQHLAFQHKDVISPAHVVVKMIRIYYILIWYRPTTINVFLDTFTDKKRILTLNTSIPAFRHLCHCPHPNKEVARGYMCPYGDANNRYLWCNIMNTNHQDGVPINIKIYNCTVAPFTNMV